MRRTTPRISDPALLLVTQIYPPKVGGSAVLFENVYTRCRGLRATVLTDASVRGSRCAGAVEAIERLPIGSDRWGIAGARRHLATAWAIRKRARRLGADTVVHCGRALPEGMAARLSRLGGGPPFVCWVHGEDLAAARTSKELTAITTWVLGGASAVFANSRNTSEFVKTFGVQADRVLVVHPGVDTVRFRPEPGDREIRCRLGLENALLLLSVGRLQARKGHDVALRAVADCRRRWPALRYLIVGDGDERSRLQALADELEIADIVIFAGEVDEADLPRYFSACDLFLLPNRVEDGDFEGFGIVFLEAAASGKPVIGGASGGVSEAVANGLTGLLVDGDSVPAVVAAIDQLASSPALRQTFGHEGRERALTFSWEAAANKVVAAHLNIVAGMTSR